MKSTKNSYEKERKKNTAAAHFSLFKMEEAHTSSSSCCDVIIFISTDSPLIFLIVLDWFSFFKEITLQHTDNLHVRHSQKKNSKRRRWRRRRRTSHYFTSRSTTFLLIFYIWPNPFNNKYVLAYQYVSKMPFSWSRILNYDLEERRQKNVAEWVRKK